MSDQEKPATSFGFTEIRYTKDQIQSLTKIYLANNKSIPKAFRASEHLWERRDWEQACFVLDFLHWINQLSEIPALYTIMDSISPKHMPLYWISEILWPNATAKCSPKG